MKIVSSDLLKGSIKAKSGFSLKKPSFKVDLVIEEMENHNTRVTISGFTVKKFFFHKGQDSALNEAEILEKLSTIM